MEARIAIIAMTTSNSISVKTFRIDLRQGLLLRLTVTGGLVGWYAASNASELLQEEDFIQH